MKREQQHRKLHDGQASGSSALSDILSGTMGGIAQGNARDAQSSERVTKKSLNPLLVLTRPCSCCGSPARHGMRGVAMHLFFPDERPCQVKVRMQSAGSSASFGRTLMTGLRAGNLYAGAMSPLLGAMLHNATLFYVNGATRAFLHNPLVHQPSRDAFIAGATVGAAATIVETPIDLIKCKLQVSGSDEGICRVAHSLSCRLPISIPTCLWRCGRCIPNLAFPGCGRAWARLPCATSRASAPTLG